MLPFVFASTLLHAGPKELQVLMLGNSHTVANDLPRTLASMLNTDGAEPVRITVRTGMFLDDLANPATLTELNEGKWDVVILQAAKMSSSHKYTYSQEGPIGLAKAAAAGKTKVLWFPEWSRKGWDEADFILGIYGADAKAGGGDVIPIPRAFDTFLKSNPTADMWNGDGNHASPAGSYLAASTIYLWFRSTSKPSTFEPSGLAPQVGSKLRVTAAATWKTYGVKSRN